MENDRFIKISPSLLGKKEEKLKVLYFEDGILALEKPFGALIDAHPWYPDIPCIVPALKKEMLQNEADFKEYNLSNIYSVYSLEPEVTGVALIATNKESSAFLRNEFGSGKFTFRFSLLGTSDLEGETVECDLPLAKHYTENKMVVSNKTGKKCKTSFNLLRGGDSLRLWEAKTDYIRMHQVRVHAMESEIHIIGEQLYTESESPRSPAYKAKLGKKVHQKPVNSNLCLHLSSVEWDQGGRKIAIHSALPQRIQKLLDKNKDL